MLLIRNSSNLAKNIRYLCSQRSFEEVKVPTPWGHMAGKWWAPHDSKPLLTFHGWQDNAGSFDRLVAHMPADIGVLALDYPGHGLSSQIPPGFFYNTMDVPFLYKRLLKYFDWDKVSLMGHSLGACSNIFFTMMYPEYVDLLICIDGLLFVSKTKAKAEGMAQTIDSFLKYDALNTSKNQPCFTLEEWKQKLYIASKESVKPEHSDCILLRKVVPVKDKPGMFTLKGDVRLRTPIILQLTYDMHIEGITRIKCPIMVTIGKKGYFHSVQIEKFKALYQAMKARNKHCYFYELDGTHHVHVNNPETVAVPINDFLSKHYVKSNLEFDLQKLKLPTNKHC